MNVAQHTIVLLCFVSMHVLMAGCSENTQNKNTLGNDILKQKVFKQLLDEKQISESSYKNMSEWIFSREENLEKKWFVSADWELWQLSLLATPPRIFIFAIHRKSGEIKTLQNDYYNFKKINSIINKHIFKKNVKSAEDAKAYYWSIVDLISPVDRVMLFRSANSFVSHANTHGKHSEQINDCISMIKPPTWARKGNYYNGVFYVAMYYMHKNKWTQNLIKREIDIDVDTGKIGVKDVVMLEDI